jgi:MFS family permease
VVAVILAGVLVHRLGGAWAFLAVLMACFFLAGSGASAAYLTVSEVFPMETRALAIAFFYAVGTAIGGITGPLLFGRLIESGDRHLVALSFLIGAAVMAVGGITELFLGVKAEGQKLEDLAMPLTTAESP